MRNALVCAIVAPVILLTVQWVLAMPAMFSRSTVDINWWWRGPLLFVFLLIGAVPSHFDSRVRSRRIAVALIVVIGAAPMALAMVNLNSPRPHIGHLAGLSGMLRYCWLECFAYTVWAAVLAAIPCVAIDMAANSVWRLLYPGRNERRAGGSLLSVTLMQCLILTGIAASACAMIRLIVNSFPANFWR